MFILQRWTTWDWNILPRSRSVLHCTLLHKLEVWGAYCFKKMSALKQFNSKVKICSLQGLVTLSTVARQHFKSIKKNRAVLSDSCADIWSQSCRAASLLIPGGRKCCRSRAPDLHRPWEQDAAPHPSARPHTAPEELCRRTQTGQTQSSHIRTRVTEKESYWFSFCSSSSSSLSSGRGERDETGRPDPTTSRPSASWNSTDHISETSQLLLFRLQRRCHSMSCISERLHAVLLYDS